MQLGGNPICHTRVATVQLHYQLRTVNPQRASRLLGLGATDGWIAYMKTGMVIAKQGYHGALAAAVLAPVPGRW